MIRNHIKYGAALGTWTIRYDTRTVLFRKTVSLSDVPEKYRIKISADSQYKLYINDRLVEVGPGKGNDKIWFYDTVDIAPYLKAGENVIGVIVLLRIDLAFLV